MQKVASYYKKGKYGFLSIRIQVKHSIFTLATITKEYDKDKR